MGIAKCFNCKPVEELLPFFRFSFSLGDYGIMGWGGLFFRASGGREVGATVSLEASGDCGPVDFGR